MYAIRSYYAEWQPFIFQKEAKYHIDLPGFIAETAIQAGVPSENIYTSDVDTATDPRMFSYLHHKQTGEPDGRFAAILKLAN